MREVVETSRGGREVKHLLKAEYSVVKNSIFFFLINYILFLQCNSKYFFFLKEEREN